MSLLLGATIPPLNMARRQSRDLQTFTQIIHLHESYIYGNNKYIRLHLNASLPTFDVYNKD